MQTRFRRPPAEVFDFLADVRNERRWHPQLRSVEKVSEGPIGAGTTFEADYKQIGRMRVEITEYERPRRLGFRATSRSMDMRRVLFTFTEAADGTDLSLELEAELRGFMRVLEPLLRPMIRRGVAGRADEMRPALEGDEPSAR